VLFVQYFYYFKINHFTFWPDWLGREYHSTNQALCPKISFTKFRLCAKIEVNLEVPHLRQIWSTVLMPQKILKHPMFLVKYDDLRIKKKLYPPKAVMTKIASFKFLFFKIDIRAGKNNFTDH